MRADRSEILKERKQTSKTQVLLFALLVAGAAALWFRQDQVSDVLAGFMGPRETKPAAAKRSRQQIPVVVARAGQADDNVTIEAISTARALRSVTLFPEADGTIVALSIKAGDHVDPGDVILKLDSEDAELAIALAKVRVAEAERALARADRLRKRNVNSAAKVDDTRTALQRTRLELKQAEETLKRRTLRAPFAGYVGIPKVEVGDRATTTTEIITIDDRSELIAEIEVAEQYLTRLARGQPVKTSTPSFGDRNFDGSIDRLDTRVDPTSRTVMVRASLPNTDDRLRPGMSFSVELHIDGESRTTVPELALQWSRGDSYVWRIAGGKSEKVPVKTVQRRKGQILIDGDIRAGDLVVIEGVQRLRPGRAVHFVEPKPSTGS